MLRSRLTANRLKPERTGGISKVSYLRISSPHVRYPIKNISLRKRFNPSFSGFQKIVIFSKIFGNAGALLRPRRPPQLRTSLLGLPPPIVITTCATSLIPCSERAKGRSVFVQGPVWLATNGISISFCHLSSCHLFLLSGPFIVNTI